VSTDPVRVLVVDDEPPARRYLVAQLERLEQPVSVVDSVGDATEALRILQQTAVDLIFLDVRMPGLDGIDLAGVLDRFERAPRVVFVTAHEEHAVDAFRVHAFDYLLKPVDPRRLADAMRRVAGDVRRVTGEASLGPATAAPTTSAIAVDHGGRTVMVERDRLLYVEASKDYSRLRTADGAYLLRVPISTLEAAWADSGWMRIHRSYLVPIAAVGELSQDAAGGWSVRLGKHHLPVSRRHLSTVRDRLHRSARALRGEAGRT
jgi:DNA-binding LytR/AlgR family response regulator